METEQAEIKPDRRPWEFMTNCRMLQLYGQDRGTLACYHASKYRYFKGHEMLTEGNGYYQRQRVIAADLNWSLKKVYRISKGLVSIGLLIEDVSKGLANFYGIIEEAWPEECRHLLNPHNGEPRKSQDATHSSQNDRTPQSKRLHHSGQNDRHKNNNEKSLHKIKKQSDFFVSDSLGKQGGIQTPASSPETVAFKLMLRTQSELSLFEGMDVAQVEKTLLRINAPRLVGRYENVGDLRDVVDKRK